MKREMVKCGLFHFSIFGIKISDDRWFFEAIYKKVDEIYLLIEPHVNFSKGSFSEAYSLINFGNSFYLFLIIRMSNLQR